MDFERARAAVLEAHRQAPSYSSSSSTMSPLKAVRSRQSSAFEHVKRRVQQDAVEVQADAAVIGPRREKRASKSLLELTPGRPCTAAAGRRPERWPGSWRRCRPGPAWLGYPGARFRRVRLNHHGLGAAESFRAEDDFEFLDVAGVQMEGTLHQVVADGRDVEHIIPWRDGGMKKWPVLSEVARYAPPTSWTTTLASASPPWASTTEPRTSPGVCA